MSDVSLNGLKVKTDSLPNDWYVSLINPKDGEPAEIMTVAKFAELFLNNNKIWTENNDGPNSKLDAGLFASKDANGYISFNGSSVNLDTINTNSFTVYNGNTIVGKPSGYGVVLTITNSDKAGTPGTVGVWINQLAFGTDGTVYFRQRIDASEWKNWKSLGSAVYSSSYNALTDIQPSPVLESRQVAANLSANTSISNLSSDLSGQEESDGSTPVKSELSEEQYVWSIDKIGKAVLELQAENKRLKQILNISDDSEVQQM